MLLFYIQESVQYKVGVYLMLVEINEVNEVFSKFILEYKILVDLMLLKYIFLFILKIRVICCRRF